MCEVRKHLRQLWPTHLARHAFRDVEHVKEEAEFTREAELGRAHVIQQGGPQWLDKVQHLKHTAEAHRRVNTKR